MVEGEEGIIEAHPGRLASLRPRTGRPEPAKHPCCEQAFRDPERLLTPVPAGAETQNEPATRGVVDDGCRLGGDGGVAEGARGHGNPDPLPGRRNTVALITIQAYCHRYERIVRIREQTAGRPDQQSPHQRRGDGRVRREGIPWGDDEEHCRRCRRLRWLGSAPFRYQGRAAQGVRRGGTRHDPYQGGRHRRRDTDRPGRTERVDGWCSATWGGR